MKNLSKIYVSTPDQPYKPSIISNKPNNKSFPSHPSSLSLLPFPLLSNPASSCFPAYDDEYDGCMNNQSAEDDVIDGDEQQLHDVADSSHDGEPDGA